MLVMLRKLLLRPLVEIAAMQQKALSKLAQIVVMLQPKIVERPFRAVEMQLRL